MCQQLDAVASRQVSEFRSARCCEVGTPPAYEARLLLRVEHVVQVFKRRFSHGREAVLRVEQYLT